MSRAHRPSPAYHPVRRRIAAIGASAALGLGAGLVTTAVAAPEAGAVSACSKVLAKDARLRAARVAVDDRIVQEQAADPVSEENIAALRAKRASLSKRIKALKPRVRKCRRSTSLSGGTQQSYSTAVGQS